MKEGGEGAKLKNLLTIAGSDCSGGAGIQADIKTFSAHGCFGMSVITAVTAQNTCGVTSVANIDVAMIDDQMDAIFEDIDVHGVKVGMLSDAAIMQAVADKLARYIAGGSRGKHNKPAFTVIDPVMIAKGGHALMEAAALDTLRRAIIPRAYLLTPNVPEAETIAGRLIESIDDMKCAARKIHSMGAKNVLVKGGHLIAAVEADTPSTFASQRGTSEAALFAADDHGKRLSGDAVDVLFDGETYQTFTHQRIDSKNTHGTGCTLSSAIAANLANGLALPDAVGAAKKYVTEAIRHAPNIGKGHGPLNHLYKGIQS